MDCSAAARRSCLLLTVAGVLALIGCAQAGSGPPDDPAISNVKANAGGPYAQLVDNPVVAFNADETYDPEEEIERYEWNFGDGATGYGVEFQHTYLDLGEYAVTLTVKNANGLALDSDTTRARIRLRPIAEFDVRDSTELVVGKPVEFDASGSQVGDGLGFLEWYRWDFGYDSAEDFTLDYVTTDSQAIRVFTRPGNYTVALVVEDDDGFRSDIVTSEILVQDTEGAIITIE